MDNNQLRYEAYGNQRIASVAKLPTDYHFTGQKQDASGLQYFNARYYDPYPNHLPERFGQWEPGDVD